MDMIQDPSLEKTYLFDGPGLAGLEGENGLGVASRSEENQETPDDEEDEAEKALRQQRQEKRNAIAITKLEQLKQAVGQEQTPDGKKRLVIDALSSWAKDLMSEDNPVFEKVIQECIQLVQESEEAEQGKKLDALAEISDVIESDILNYLKSSKEPREVAQRYGLSLDIFTQQGITEINDENRDKVASIVKQNVHIKDILPAILPQLEVKDTEKGRDSQGVGVIGGLEASKNGEKSKTSQAFETFLKHAGEESGLAQGLDTTVPFILDLVFSGEFRDTYSNRFNSLKNYSETADVDKEAKTLNALENVLEKPESAAVFFDHLLEEEKGDKVFSRDNDIRGKVFTLYESIKDEENKEEKLKALKHRIAEGIAAADKLSVSLRTKLEESDVNLSTKVMQFILLAAEKQMETYAEKNH